MGAPNMPQANAVAVTGSIAQTNTREGTVAGGNGGAAVGGPGERRRSGRALGAQPKPGGSVAR